MIILKSSISPAKSESSNNPSLHCCAVFPTWYNCCARSSANSASLHDRVNIDGAACRMSEEEEMLMEEDA